MELRVGLRNDQSCTASGGAAHAATAKPHRLKQFRAKHTDLHNSTAGMANGSPVGIRTAVGRLGGMLGFPQQESRLAISITPRPCACQEKSGFSIEWAGQRRDPIDTIPRVAPE